MRRLMVGVLLGIGCILPGVSGGVMAVSFGLYRPMLDALSGFFKDVRKNGWFLLPLAAGGAIGVFLGAVALQSLMRRYETPLLYLFIGMILGGVPGLLREANAGGFRRGNWVALAAGLLAASSLLLLQNAASGATLTNGELLPIQAVATGAIIAVGTIVPGVSTSFLLIYLGWYQALLDAIAGGDIATLLWTVAGCVLCALLTLRLTKLAFERFPGYSYYFVLGFLLVSVALVFPGASWSWAQLAYCVLLALGAWCGVRMGRVEAKQA